jgi:hypothetical protein
MSEDPTPVIATPLTTDKEEDVFESDGREDELKREWLQDIIRSRKEYRLKRMEVSVDGESLNSSVSLNEVVDDEELRNREKFAALRIWVYYKYWKKREDIDRIRWAILNRLVVSLQRLFRQRKARRENLLEERNEGVNCGNARNPRFLLPELLREKNFEVPREKRMIRKKVPRGRRRSSVGSVQGEELYEEKTVEVKQVEVPVMAAPVAVSGEDKRAYGMMKIQASIRSFIWRDFLVKMKGEFLLEDIVNTALDTDEPPPEGSGTIVELEPVDVYLPADVKGVLDHGTVLKGPEQIVGLDITATKEDEWIVDEIEDLGEFDEYEKSLERAAIRVQRFYRKRCARIRFRQMVEEAIQAAQEGRPIPGNDPPNAGEGNPSETDRGAGSSVTSNCVLM